MCVYSLPTGKDILDSPRDQTEIVAEGMLVLPKLAVQTAQCDGDSLPSLPDGVVVFTCSTGKTRLCG